MCCSLPLFTSFGVIELLLSQTPEWPMKFFSTIIFMGFNVFLILTILSILIKYVIIYILYIYKYFICVSIHCGHFSFLCTNCIILGPWEPFRLVPVSFFVMNPFIFSSFLPEVINMSQAPLVCLFPAPSWRPGSS